MATNVMRIQSPLVPLKLADLAKSQISMSAKVRKGRQLFYGNKCIRNYEAYDHNQINHAIRSNHAGKIIETFEKQGQGKWSVPLPTKKEVVTILRAVHKYKDSREQFEQRTHKRLIDVIAPTQKTIEALTKMDIPSGVAVNLKMKEK